MATVHLVCGKYYDFEKKQHTVGGIQTYMTALLPIAKARGYECIIYQNDTESREIITDGVRIVSVGVQPDLKDIKKIKKSMRACMCNYNDETDILIFTTDTRIVGTNVKRSIAIQHGINWDMPVHENWKPILSDLYAFSRAKLTARICSNLRKVKKVVCVDHNFPNWMRASIAYQSADITVIPNFTKISEKVEKPDDIVKVIFARRFEKYRGTRIFCEAVSKILDEYSNVQVTLAGTGPDEVYLKEKLQGKNVEFIRYKSGESLMIHADKHIAVVPTIGSEGTSLSLLEAMSAQCAVVCTDVGGMSNIVLDGYNGLISERNPDSLYLNLRKLIEDSSFRNKLAEKAYETVKAAFSYDIWEKKWNQVFDDVSRM